MKLRRALALLIAVPLAAGAPATVPVMLNLDGDLSFRGATPAQSEARLAELVDTIARMGVTTLAYSIGAGSDILYYPTQAASTWGWRTTPYNTLPEWRSRIRFRTRRPPHRRAPRPGTRHAVYPFVPHERRALLQRSREPPANRSVLDRAQQRDHRRVARAGVRTVPAPVELRARRRARVSACGDRGSH